MADKRMKAQKTYTCTQCGGTINKGDQYRRITYPIMHGCSPEKESDTVLCPQCVVKADERTAARKAAHEAWRTSIYA